MCGFCVLLLRPLCPIPRHCVRSSPEQILSACTNETSDKRPNNRNCDNTFKFILDCNDIQVTAVEELVFNDTKQHIFAEYNDWNKKEKVKLDFTVEEWCLKIWKPGIFCSCEFPSCVMIEYETQPHGQSLMWVPDQDGKPAVYNYGAWINNRSLFPCQEPPIAMATWEATISVPEPAVVIMSGDERARCSSKDGVTSFYYHTKLKLPLSTLALAIGYWEVEEKFSQQQSSFHVDIRMWATPSLLCKIVKEFSTYAHSCIEAAESILGPYPFSRVDFLVVPRGFSSLGMASPNVIFISQSLICGDGSMCCRIAHELAHSWFGLLIGASDWTEEWLSEGFATFIEDIIHVRAISMTSTEEMEYYELKAFTRAKTLCAEVKNTEKELHILRPNRGAVPTQNVDGVEAVILKNGKNPEKSFMQVHYIKGYFLLKYLSDFVGLPKFLRFLNSYVAKFRGQLVDSLEMLQFYCDLFPAECIDGLTVDGIAMDWLHSTKVPKSISCMKLSASNSMNQTAIEETDKWTRLNRSNLMRKSKKRRKMDVNNFSKISSDILSLVLDVLLRKETISHSVMKIIQKVYDIEEKNAEVRHRWCELVVKHRYYPGYGILQKFLEDDLAMGVYLYGELILNGTASQRALAEQCFHKMRKEMEPNCVFTILQMLEQISDV